MSSGKKAVRAAFRDAVFTRDGNLCRICSEPGELDAHHITDRNLMPNGGYVAENGISLCPPCHEKAEMFHSTGTAEQGYGPEELYAEIDSNLSRAIKASHRLRI